MVGIFLDPDATWHYLDHAKDSITNHFYNFQISRRSSYAKLLDRLIGEYEFDDSFDWVSLYSYDVPKIQIKSKIPDATNQANISECSEEVTNVDVFEIIQ